MKYNVNKKEKDMIELSIELNKEEWNGALEKAYESTKSKYEVKGFRKGKATRKAIENAYGSMIFVDDAIDVTYKENFISIITKEKLFPVSSPAMALEKCDDTGLKMTLTFQNKPSVELGDYKGIEIEGKKIEVSEKDVENQINRMAERNVRKVEVTDREVKNGDIANIDFSGSVDGKKFDGGTAQGYELEIGSHSFIEGFEEQIVGMKLNEEKDINVKFPESYHSSDLAGKDAVFAIKLNKILVKEMPEINDEWASMASEFETLKELKADVEKKLKEDAQAQADTENTNALIDKIVTNAKFEIPECMVEDELDYILGDFEQKLAMQGMKMDDYLKLINKTMKDVRDEQRDIAKANCGIRLVIETLIEKEKITVKEKDIDEKIENIAKMYGQTKEDMKKNLREEDLSYFKNEALMDKLIAFLKENNKIKQ